MEWRVLLTDGHLNFLPQVKIASLLLETSFPSLQDAPWTRTAQCSEAGFCPPLSHSLLLVLV